MTQSQTFLSMADNLAALFVKRGIRARVDKSQGIAQPVNVWAEPLDRYPAHTVWVDADGFTWGPNFEFNRPAGTDFPAVVRAVRETLASARR